MNKIRSIIKYIAEGTLGYYFRCYCWKKIRPYRFYNFICNYHKVVSRKIVFSNFAGKGYGGDPKYIAEYIINNNLDFDMVWLIDPNTCGDIEAFPRKIKLVNIFSLKAMKELSTAQFWIDNCRKFECPPKKRGQIYIQTWHGTFPTKYIEKDAESALSAAYIEVAKKDSENIDYILSGCKEKTKVYKESFYYDGIVLETGTPKDDIFFDKKYISEYRFKVKKYLGISDDCKVILYAPTFRQNMGVEVYDMDYQKVVNAFSEKNKCECKLLVRFHPIIVEQSKKLKFPDNVINVTTYPDMQELLCAADIIISDYSSTLDYSIFDKPVFLYCPDLVEYQSRERDFYIKLEELPFPIACSNEEMIRNIYSFDSDKYLKDLRDTYKKYGLCEDGNACQSVVQLMNDLCK